MALDPVVNQLREIALSGTATLADIPFLAQRLKQGQTGQFGQTVPGLPSEEAGRGGGSGLGAGLFEPVSGGEILAGGGGGGLSSLDNFVDQFGGVDLRAAGFGGRGGPDAEGGGTVGIGSADFGPTSDVGLALSLFGALTGIPAAGFSNALSSVFGPFGVTGPSRPEVGTQGFRDVTNATQAARDLSRDIEGIQGVIGRDLTPAEIEGLQAAINDRLGRGSAGTEGGSPTGGGGVAGGPGAGAGPGGVGPGAPGTGPAGTGPAGPPGSGGASGGGAGGAGGGDGGPGGSGGGSGPGDAGGGAGQGRHIGGIVSEDERPGITAGDVPNQLLQEGEFIVRREAVQGVGEPFLDALNILAANFEPKRTRNALRELLR